MRRSYAITGLVALAAALAGWAALAGAQQNLSKLPPNDTPPVEAAPDSGPTVTPLPQPMPAGPTGVPLPLPLPPVPSTGDPKPSRLYVPPATLPPLDGDRLRPVGATTEERSRVTPVAREERPAEPNLNLPENPIGRQEPAVSLEWLGPTLARVGQPMDYTVAVRNICTLPVQQVMVRVRVPSGVQIASTKPKAYVEGNVLMWELGTLQPKQEMNLQVRLVPESKGDVACRAWVTFTGASAMQVRVREPKLLVKTAAPSKVLIGDAASFVLTVSNPGDGPVEQAKVHALLSDGLEHARGPRVEFDVGTLAPGETRTLQLHCVAKAGGVHKCDATAEGEGGLKSQDLASVQVVVPRLEVEVSETKLLPAERKSVYTLKVTNAADASASSVTVSEVLPAGVRFVSASDGGRHETTTQTVSWFLGEVGPGQTRQVKLEILAVNPGEIKHKASAVASRWTVR
ncbi:MAG: DUF11 domain-containing protein [Gemmataceae bacterium]|nr:DUF11 domain-containing protein [Gemmataceae bacterium]